jgi:hypothetical protein
VTWQLRALCRTRPADWWDVPNDGNRLAIGLCQVCPVRSRCAETDTEPAGVVRGGVAYRDTGERAQVCPCGRPIPRRRDSGDCYQCVPLVDTPVPAARPVRRRGRPAAAEPATERQIVALRDGGVSFRTIAAEYRLPVSTVQSIVKRVKAGSVQ